MFSRQKKVPTSRWRGLLAAMLLFPWSALWAVGFGELDVNSYLNQPFDATIELLSTDDVRNLSVELAGPSRYQRMDISPPRNLSDYTATLSLVGGKNVVRLNSKLPVTDLVIDLVLIMNADDSESMRHYPVIIDFAPQIDGVVTTPVPTPSAPEPREIAEPVSTPRPRRVAAVSSGNNYGPVQSGQTLSQIVSDLAGDQPLNGFQYMQAIVDLNPDAFIGGDMNRMRAGVSLTLPEMAGFSPRVSAPSPRPAAPAPERMAEAPAAVVTPEVAPQPATPTRQSAPDEDSRLELVGTPTSGEILNSLNNWLDEDDAELGLRAQEARRDLAYATAEIETYRKENDVLKNRVGELEGRIETLRKLIALRAAEEQDLEAAAAEQELGAAAQGAADETAPESSSMAVAPTAQATPDPTPSPMAVESELANATNTPEAAQRTSGLGWWPWVLGVLLLLVLTFIVWYRGRREDQQRAQRTADLVHRIQQAGKRNTGELDIAE